MDNNICAHTRTHEIEGLYRRRLVKDKTCANKPRDACTEEHTSEIAVAEIRPGGMENLMEGGSTHTGVLIW